MTTATGKVALVTGGASGIGAAISERLAEDGFTVLIADLNPDTATKKAESINATGRTASAVQLDVASRASWENVIKTVAQRTGRLDVLVNNAGITRDRSLLRMEDDEWDQVIAVHLTGTWLGCQHAIPLLKETQGVIVNLSSEGRHGSFGQANYSAAKAGVVGLTRTAAIEHARHGIRVNAVAPGPVRTPMLAAVPDDVVEGWLTTIPLRRIAEPSEIASAVSFLVSPDSSYITGQVLAVDGGSTHP